LSAQCGFAKDRTCNSSVTTIRIRHVLEIAICSLSTTSCVVDHACSASAVPCRLETLPWLLFCSIELLPIVHVLVLFSSPTSLVFRVQAHGKGEVLPIFDLRCISYQRATTDCLSHETYLLGDTFHSVSDTLNRVAAQNQPQRGIAAMPQLPHQLGALYCTDGLPIVEPLYHSPCMLRWTGQARIWFARVWLHEEVTISAGFRGASPSPRC
jgi:hypothetical protein